MIQAPSRLTPVPLARPRVTPAAQAADQTRGASRPSDARPATVFRAKAQAAEPPHDYFGGGLVAAIGVAALVFGLMGGGLFEVLMGGAALVSGLCLVVRQAARDWSRRSRR